MAKQGFKARLAKLFTAQLLIAVIFFILMLTAFVAITDEIVLEHESTFDTVIYSKVSKIDSPAMTNFFEAVTFFGSRAFLLPAYIILILIFLKKTKWALAIDVTLIGLTTALLLDLFKNIFKRTRPLNPLIQNVTGFSYPSGHSFSSYTFYGLIVFLIWKTNISNAWKIAAAIFFFIVATSIAFSRVYLRVHYPSDVIAGFCLSIIWLMTSLWLLEKKNKYLPGKNL